MNPSAEEVLILVNVAPMQPYPELYRSGPEQTWCSNSVPGTRVLKVQGLPPKGFRRQLADLRLMMSFPQSLPSAIGTVDSQSLLMRGYARLVSLSQRQGYERGLLTNFRAKFFRTVVLACSQGTRMWARHYSSFRKNLFRASVELQDDTIQVHRVQTINNSMALRLDVLHALARGEAYRGVAFVTASAYVERRRLLNWINRQSVMPVVGGSDALANGDEPSSFLSGFFTYFSWEVVVRMASSRDFDHSLADDAATTKWLKSQGISWVDPGIHWDTSSMEMERCPLCDNLAASVVRCTSHGSRQKESEYMKKLHHNHDVE